MGNPKNIPRRRSEWLEPVGDGIHRAHRRSCVASRDRESGHRCECPYTYWLPRDGYAKRRRARVYGTLQDARTAKHEAHDQAAQRRRTLANQQAGAAPMPTLDGWFEQLMQRKWGTMRPSTQYRRRQDYDRRIRPHLGKRRLDRITPSVIEAWLYEMLEREGIRRSTQMGFETLHEMLKLATQQNLIRANPAADITYPEHAIPESKRRVLTLGEYAQLITTANGLRERTLLRALCEAGLRRGEAVGLQVGDLDLDTGYIHVHRRIIELTGQLDIDTPKGRRSRTVAISDTLREELAWYLLDRGCPTDDAFVWLASHPKTPKRLTGSGVTYLVHTAARAA